MKTVLLLVIAGCLLNASCQSANTAEKIALPDNGDNEFIIDLNRLAYTIAAEHDQFYSLIGVRALAMMHLAMHDILNAADPQFESYHFVEQVEEAEVHIAAVVAAGELLQTIYPDRRDTIQLVCDKWLSAFRQSPQYEKSRRLGTRVARSYIDFRANDGHEKRGDYTPMGKPGDYQFTPGYDWVFKPDFSVAMPFTMDSVQQFRSPPPPGLETVAYATSFNEVKKLGQKESKYRDLDQTHIAHWWAEFGEHGWNRIARKTAVERKLSANAANRMFALLNMNLYDLYLASLESKYQYDTWRPYTAIHAAENDGNPDTDPDQSWEPEMVTPPWPEYPSAHAAVGAAGAVIVSGVFGTDSVYFAMESTTALPGAEIRSYQSLAKAAEDCASSRVYNGFHFRFATDEGKRQGAAIAKHTLENVLRPLKNK